MPRGSHGTEAGARLCNAIRKMLERHEQLQNSEKSITQAADLSSKSPSLLARSLTPEVKSSEHQLTSVAQSETQQLLWKENPNPESSRPKAGNPAITQTSSAGQDTLEMQPSTFRQGSYDSAIVRPLLTTRHRQSSSDGTSRLRGIAPFRPRMSGSPVYTTFERLSVENSLSTRLPQIDLPKILQPRLSDAQAKQKLINVTTDNEAYYPVFVTDISANPRACRERIAAKLGVVIESLYITQ